jgi:hypothetical protein
MRDAPWSEQDGMRAPLSLRGGLHETGSVYLLLGLREEILKLGEGRGSLHNPGKYERQVSHVVRRAATVRVTVCQMVLAVGQGFPRSTNDARWATWFVW